MFVRWADAPGPVTAFYRMFFSIFMLAPFVLPRVSKNSAIRSWNVAFPLLAGVFTALDLALWTTALSYTTHWEHGSFSNKNSRAYFGADLQ